MLKWLHKRRHLKLRLTLQLIWVKPNHLYGLYLVTSQKNIGKINLKNGTKVFLHSYLVLKSQPSIFTKYERIKQAPFVDMIP